MLVKELHIFTFYVLAPEQRGIPLEVKLNELQKNKAKSRSLMVYNFKRKDDLNRSTMPTKRVPYAKKGVTSSGGKEMKPLQTVFKVIGQYLASTKDKT